MRDRMYFPVPAQPRLDVPPDPPAPRPRLAAEYVRDYLIPQRAAEHHVVGHLRDVVALGTDPQADRVGYPLPGFSTTIQWWKSFGLFLWHTSQSSGFGGFLVTISPVTRRHPIALLVLPVLFVAL